MTTARGSGDDQRLSRAAAALVEAEQRIRLLDRVMPRNLASERQRLRRALSRDEVAEPAFEYRPPPDFSVLRRSLEWLARDLEPLGALGRLYAERARELLLEVALAESVGGKDFAARAAERYPAESSDELDELVRQFESAPISAEHELIRAGDETHPQSLVSVLRVRIGASQLPVRVELRTELQSVAAAGDGFVAVREGALLGARAAERIACHELLAHVLPRIEARREPLGFYRAGTRHANEDEEGRALCIEERLGFWDGARRAELARRHRVAVGVRSGATLNELVRELVVRGLESDEALELALRALRGGGLGREIVYLPAYLQLARAFAADRECERYFERGRVSLAALPLLREAELNH